jgi:pimeloyl-ACP methyl ester carboxylesterase
MELLPLGVPVLLVHGHEDKNVPITQTDDYARAARASGDFVEVQSVPGGDHFVVIDPTSGAWDDVVRSLPLILVPGSTSPSGLPGSP